MAGGRVDRKDKIILATIHLDEAYPIEIKKKKKKKETIIWKTDF